ncbi:MAG: UDP-N-acetylglucosamine 1-carboxyvinyltransferase [candidate division WOR-3 bacterium]|nr:UDP-N-acetylglucosamine 1-carboxyvinyltransferase [candidate division WOR-3 bacterium]
MDRFVIEGGKRLSGVVEISGAKNSALPIIAASILTDKRVIIENVPDVMDVHTMIQLVEYLGSVVKFKRNILEIYTPKIKRIIAPYNIVRKMRASYYVLGALIAREKKAKVSLPGGCAIGPRPVDLHIKGIKALGCDVDIEQGYIVAKSKKLKGVEINLQGAKGTSVGATINVMLAATGAEGVTTINFAACEPEVVDVANFLKKLGIEIEGAGTNQIKITGGNCSCSEEVRYRIIPDRIETGTFAVASAITMGDVEIKNCEPHHLTAVIDKLRETGAVIEVKDKEIIVRGNRPINPTDIFVAPYPGFPTDMQAQFMALLSLASGTSTIKETIFENRFMQAVELSRMGANITLEGDTAVIKGVKSLSGTYVMASDLRASACLVLAGLAAKGKTYVRRIYHLDRGYEKFEKKLRKLGARIRREKE